MVCVRVNARSLTCGRLDWTTVRCDTLSVSGPPLATSQPRALFAGLLSRLSLFFFTGLHRPTIRSHGVYAYFFFYFLFSLASVPDDRFFARSLICLYTYYATLSLYSFLFS